MLTGKKKDTYRDFIILDKAINIARVKYERCIKKTPNSVEKCKKEYDDTARDQIRKYYLLFP